MKEYHLQKDGRLSRQDRDDVVDLLNNGGVVVVPTDTSYGLAALVTNKKGVSKVFKLKGRILKKTSSMVVKGKKQALEYGRISRQPTKIWKAFLPGPLTLVVSAKKRLKCITRDDNTVAIRLIPNLVINQLLHRLKAPITITSANKSELPDVYSLKQFIKQYKTPPFPDAFINAGRLPKRQPSTVVKYSKENGLEIMRSGPISKNRIEKVIYGEKN